ncbi:Ribokinase-like protein [Drosera capensis]
MKAISFKHLQFHHPSQLPPQITHKDQLSLKTKPNPSHFNPKSFSSSPPPPSVPPLVVIGSANADIYLEIERLPLKGETISAKSGQTLAGGKGANQAVCGGKLNYPTYFLGQIGDDANGTLIAEALEGGGVGWEYVRKVKGVSTGHAVVMLQDDGENSIVIVGGANMNEWGEGLRERELEVVRGAGIVLLQREIPDHVNIQVAKVRLISFCAMYRFDDQRRQAAKEGGVPVILDAGGMDAPIPQELLNFVDILSPNESELARLTGMPTETFEEISQAVLKCYDMLYSYRSAIRFSGCSIVEFIGYPFSCMLRKSSSHPMWIPGM